MTDEEVKPTFKIKAGMWLIFLLVLAIVMIELFDTRTYYGIALHAVAIPAIAYPTVYMKAPWRETSTGRALMNNARAIAIFVILSIASFWQPFHFDGYLFCLALTYLGWAFSYQFIVMRRVQRAANMQEARR